MAKMVASRSTQMKRSSDVLKFRDTEIRIEALRAAARIHGSKPTRKSTEDVIEAAKEFEEYLKGQK